MDVNVYLNVEEISKGLSVAEETVRRWIRTGRLRAQFICKEYRIKQEDLDAFLKDNPKYSLRIRRPRKGQHSNEMLILKCRRLQAENRALRNRIANIEDELQSMIDILKED